MGITARVLHIELEAEIHLVRMQVLPSLTLEGYHWLPEITPQHISIIQSQIHYRLINLRLENLVIMVDFPSMEK